jgi:hypothetical protein
MGMQTELIVIVLLVLAIMAAAAYIVQLVLAKSDRRVAEAFVLAERAVSLSNASQNGRRELDVSLVRLAEDTNKLLSARLEESIKLNLAMSETAQRAMELDNERKLLDLNIARRESGLALQTRPTSVAPATTNHDDDRISADIGPRPDMNASPG